MCGFLNDEKAQKEIKLNLKFADSFEEIKSAEKRLKREKVTKARDEHYQAARAKAKLAKGDKFYKSHASKLTSKQIQAVAFKDCGVRLTGKVAQLRESLTNILPDDLGIPEYPTQDDMMMDDVGDGSDSDGSETDEYDPMALLSFIDMRGGMYVQVWWEGDKVWYSGQVTGIERQTNMFEIHYSSDDKKLWHYASDYSVRMDD